MELPDVHNQYYAGGPRGRDNMDSRYWMLVMNGAPQPEHTDVCVCGEIIPNVDSTKYVKHALTGDVRTVGLCCFAELPVSHQRRTCEDCHAPHRSTTTNKCNSCNPNGRRNIMTGYRRRQARLDAEINRLRLDNGQEFDEMDLEMQHLDFIKDALFPHESHKASLKASQRADDDSMMYINLFYEQQIQATMYFSTETDTLVRSKAQGGPAVQAHIDANWHRIQTTLALMVDLSRAKAEVARVLAGART